ncbi:MAG: DNA-binding protein [Clostridia bacterium]|nr:DNA-binding protein [Clostridia bacterium]
MRGVEMAVNPNITILLDLYGELLTTKERDALDYYYNEDLSLKEIADNEAAERRMRREQGYATDGRDTISRQGVRDTIKRAENKLLEWESKLHLAQRGEEIGAALDKIALKAKEINECNLRHGCLHDISDAVSSIVSTADSIREKI